MAEPPKDEPEQAPQDGDMTPEPGSVADVQAAVTRAANRFLKDRFALREREDGVLEIPEPAPYQELANNAQRFVQGFLAGFDTTRRDPDSPDPGGLAQESVVALLARAKDALSDTWNAYLNERVVPQRTEEQAPVRVDGEFVRNHAGSLLATAIRDLTAAFNTDDPGTARVADLPADGEKRPVEVDVQLDVKSLFRALLGVDRGSR